MSESVLKLEGVSKSFGNDSIIKDFHLSVEDGEFLSLLGPSGSGKSTILRMVAGLEAPDAGAIFLEGHDVTQLPPEKRNVNTVFQSYALFPHMSVRDNISYALRVRRVDRETIDRETRRMIQLVRLEGKEMRKPRQLSGGERQRVAIARALINSPKVLLLDEPLSALDAALRRDMQKELKDIQRKSGTAFVYVTHDQEEAMNLSDRIVLIDRGRIVETGTPEEIYARPKTAFAASFLGCSNILEGTVRKDGGKTYLRFLGYETETGIGRPTEDGESIRFALREEHVRVSPLGGEGIPAVLDQKYFRAGMQRLVFRTHDGTMLTASVPSDGGMIEPGSTVTVSFDGSKAAVLDEE